MSEEDFNKVDVNGDVNDNDSDNEVQGQDVDAIGKAHSDYHPKKDDGDDDTVKYQLSGMYQNWFLDYASYVILERAVPLGIIGLANKVVIDTILSHSIEETLRLLSLTAKGHMKHNLSIGGALTGCTNTLLQKATETTKRMAHRAIWRNPLTP